VHYKQGLGQIYKGFFFNGLRT